jgi:hypothetical protein
VIEEEIARELSFEETTDADSEYGFVAPSASAFSVERTTTSSYSSSSSSSSSASASSFMKSPAQAIAERDSTIFQVDACDWVVQDPHSLMLLNSARKRSPVVAPVRPPAPVTPAPVPVRVLPPTPPPAPAAPVKLPPVAEFWDDIYDVFPFVFKGPGIRVAIAIAGVAHKGSALKLEALHARYASRPFHFPWKLLLLCALVAFFATVTGPAMAYLRAQASSGPVALSGGGVVTERDMQRIGDRVLAGVKANVGTLELVTLAQLLLSEKKLTAAFTGLNDKLGAQAASDVAALRLELLKTLRGELGAAVQTGKADLAAFEKAAALKFVTHPELDAAVKAGKADLAAYVKVADGKFVTHPELDAVERKLAQWMEQQLTAQTARATADLGKAAAQTAELVKREVAGAQTATSKDLELLRVKLTALVETEVMRASQASQTQWTAALDKMRLDLAGGNLVETLTQQVRSKIMDSVTADATKAAMDAADRAGRESFSANLAASVKAAKEAAAEIAKFEADKAIAAAMVTSTAAGSSAASVAEARVAAAIEKAHSAAAEAARAQADAKVAAAKAEHADAAAARALDAASKVAEQAAAAAAAVDARFKQAAEQAFSAGSPGWARARAELLSAAETGAASAAAAVKADLSAELAKLAATVRAEQEKLSALTATVTSVDKRVAAAEGSLAALGKDTAAAQAASASASEAASAAARAVAELKQRVESLTASAAAGSTVEASEVARLTVLITAVEARAAAAAEQAAAAGRTAAEAVAAGAAAQQSAAAAATAAQLAALEKQVAQLTAAAAAAKDAAATAAGEAETAKRVATAAAAAAAQGVDTAALRSQIDDALEIFAADRTALVDFATKGAGGRVLAHTPTHTPQYSSNNLMSWLTSCYVPTKSPDTILEPNMDAGSCWPMAGHQGFVFVQLSAPIKVTKFTLQHISHTVAGNITTAPRGFRLYGVSAAAVAQWRDAGTDGEPAGTLLGEYTYDARGPRAVQTFAIPPSPAAQGVYAHVKIEVLGNHGNQDFTCIYRIRVHGETPSA